MSTVEAAPAAENQLEFVKSRLSGMNANDRAQLALESGMAVRTLYHITHPDRKPSYETVFRIYGALRRRDLAKQ